MDMTFLKFITTFMVLCEIAGSVPIRDNQYINPRHKRTAQFFGVRINTSHSALIPVSITQSTLNTIGNLFNVNGNVNRKQTYATIPEYQNEISIPKMMFIPHKGSTVKNLEPHSSTKLHDENPGIIVPEQIIPDTNNEDAISQKKKAKINVTSETEENIDPIVETTIVPISDNSTKTTVVVSAKNDSEIKIDKQILDFIFNNNGNSIDGTTTETTETSDYTTETGDYESTTMSEFDDLLRIPAPVVASLLG